MAIDNEFSVQREIAPGLPLSPADSLEPESYTPWQLFGRAMRPSFKASHLLAGLLCVLLGVALVTQIRAVGPDQLATMRQEDLIRLLDDLNSRAAQLDAEVSRLQSARDELVSEGSHAQAAMDFAEQRAATEGILSGRLPAQGPGISLEITDTTGGLRASDLFNVLEELRNAGAEAVQVNDVRIRTSSSFIDTDGGIALDGILLGTTSDWLVIGDPTVLDRALEIPGGALPTVRSRGGMVSVEQQELVPVTATAELTIPEFARAATE